MASEGDTVNLSQYDDLADAVSSIQSTRVTLVLDADDNSNATVPVTMSVQPTIGNVMSGTVTWNGPVVGDPMFYWLGGTGHSFGATSVEAVYPHWFGGQVGTGSYNDEPELEKALKAARSHVKTVRVPAGTYRLDSTLDFSQVFTGQNYHGIGFFCDPGAEFKANSNSVNPVVKLATASGHGFYCSRFEFGHINGNTKSVVGLQVTAVRDSQINVCRVSACASNAGASFYAGDGSDQSVFNNVVTITRSFENGHGIQLRSPTSGSYGVQGNQFHLGQIQSNTSVGILVGGNRKDISDRNLFYVGACEINGAYGIRDYTGANMYIVGSSNSNVSAGVRLESTAQSTKVEGCIQDSTKYQDQTGGRLQINGVHGPVTLSVNDSTPSVGVATNYMVIPKVFACANTSSTTITRFDGGTPGQIITVRIDNRTTIDDNSNLRLAGSQNFSGDANDTITLVCVASGVWMEVSRSNN